MDDSSFAEDCCLFDWDMDCGNAFFQKYKCKSFNDALPYINQEDTIALLGSLLFSHWRYFNHWAYSGIEILEYRNWFVIVLQRIKSLQSTLYKVQFRLVKAHHDATQQGGFFRGELIGNDEEHDGFGKIQASIRECFSLSAAKAPDKVTNYH